MMEMALFPADSRINTTSENRNPNDVFSASALNYTPNASVTDGGVTAIVSDVAVGDIVKVANVIDSDTILSSDGQDGVTAGSTNDEMVNTHSHADHTGMSIGIPEELGTLTTPGGIRRPRLFAKLARKYRKRRAAMEEKYDMVVYTSGKGISDIETQEKEEIKHFETPQQGFENVSFIIFLLICLGLTSYVTYVQFLEYLKNEDTASIEYRKFNLEEKDLYPTFTLCFWPIQLGAHFDGNHYSFIRNNITPSLYGSFLIGDEDDDPKYDQIVYEDVVLSIIHNYVTGFASYGLNGSETYLVGYDDAHEDKIPLLVTIQRPHNIGGIITCISRQVSYQRDVKRLGDVIFFNATVLSEKDYIMSLYIHQPGYAVRAIKDTSLWKISTRGLRKSNLEYEYHINKVEILRRRHDSKVRCDEGLLDETKISRETVMKKVGCIPAYWQTFAGDITPEMPKCKQSQYRTIYNNYLIAWYNIKLYETQYIQPCSTMSMSVILRDKLSVFDRRALMTKGLNSSKENATIQKYKSNLKLVFKYGQDEYKEIINKRAYTVETLLGQVGGFVGKS